VPYGWLAIVNLQLACAYPHDCGLGVWKLAVFRKPIDYGFELGWGSVDSEPPSTDNDCW
jgi:hypothetical protein